MVAPGSIRAGAAYVEITADDAPMFRRLRDTQSRLRAWVAQQNAQPLTKGTEGAVLGQGREGGFLTGGFRGMEFAETGLRFVTAIQAARVALTDVKMLSSAVRGDWEGMRKVAEDLPFGLGQVTKELGAMADAAGRWLVEWAHPKSLYDKLGEEARAKELRESVRIHNERLQGEKAILQAKHALMRATMDARSLARAEVAEMALPADQAEKLLSLKLTQIDAEERRREVLRAVGEEQARATRETEAGWRRAEEAERAKAALVERQTVAYRAMQDALADVERRGLESRAGLDAIAREEAGALRALAENPNFRGAIGVTHDTVEGVDITVPVYHFSETHYKPASQVTDGYKGTLFGLTGKVNNATFRGCAAGECLFLGASGSKRGDDDWEITYRFAASPNRADLTIGDITGVAKKGWEYLWVHYVDDEDATAKRLVKRPAFVRVEKVYETGDFSGLGI